ncbi:putative malate dehydrogenase 1B isoform X3 [Hippocampus zosterae]|uniref:putative malate dehydrogenase 1B isoform X3 n=1 Tax=Hippocampus zosterae TaxID=109293 RepID=UPI00223DF265|nr:putative malate dehydrogenase 1B isoform X3 [Hippocampus zosterae]
MAKFVLAGRTDCPYYAKAELLADRLARSLPNFRIHKISILPDEWKDWLQDTCMKNGWKHEESPLVWRELVHQGGKGVFLGGFDDFLEHCQNYYNITSDMSEEMMQSIAEENLETKITLILEAHHRASLIQPLHIWISSALNPTCNMLIPSLLSTEVLSQASAISLHLLDVEGNEEELESLKMETEDLALPLLHQVTIHTDLKDAFQKAEIILLLDDHWSGGNNATDVEQQQTIKALAALYAEYGRLIEERANGDVKVIVSGGSLVNLRCSLLLKACSLDSRRFVAVATQLENEARAAIANKLRVRTSEVTDVIVWGDVGDSFYIDLQRANVFNYDGPIKGPPFFSHPVLEIIYDREWVEGDFQDIVRSQRAAVVSKTCRGADMSTANGILTLLKAWNGTLTPSQVFSVGVSCTDHYELPGDVILSVPVTFTDGQWSVVSDVTVGDDLKQKLHLFASNLRKKMDTEKPSTEVNQEPSTEVNQEPSTEVNQEPDQNFDKSMENQATVDTL